MNQPTPYNYEALREQITSAKTEEDRLVVQREITKLVDSGRDTLQVIFEKLEIPYKASLKSNSIVIHLRSELDKIWFGKIPIHKLPSDTMPPDDLDTIPTRKGEGKERKELKEQPRYQLVEQVLIEMGITRTNCITYQGEVTKDMYRSTPYQLIVIPELNKMIHLCVEKGNQTFIIHNDTNYESYLHKGKKWHYKQPNIDNFSWCDPEEWKTKLQHYLSQEQAETKVQKMTSEYFHNPDYIKMDLQAFATKAGVLVKDLNTNNLIKNEVTCSNGELVKGFTYLRRAKTADFGETYSEALTNLKKLIEIETEKYIEMNIEYFTEKNVRNDLQAFADKADVSIKDLHTGNLTKNEVICSNGELVKGQTYLKRAKKAGFGTKSTEALNNLKKLIGIEVEE